MLSVIYVECHKEALTLGVVILNVIMLTVIMLTVIMLTVIMLSVIMLHAMAPDGHIHNTSFSL
jgi:hypothetical protein